MSSFIPGNKQFYLSPANYSAEAEKFRGKLSELRPRGQPNNEWRQRPLWIVSEVNNCNVIRSEVFGQPVSWLCELGKGKGGGGRIQHYIISTICMAMSNAQMWRNRESFISWNGEKWNKQNMNSIWAELTSLLLQLNVTNLQLCHKYPATIQNNVNGTH